ncbi:cobyric acid synthase CobQ [Saccharobesus litoralis]|uniref:Cobyric acid synthase n=1 Tax=Saccharobesus litoralis TaxID=2172099 RepID=A0A2S0VXH2_9ALTE|nr:cobyric acid synthase [Saccharobesus litoralis]AWB68872.1 cobyric acid synthase CobQ [Saccharobesus litoralis]
MVQGTTSDAGKSTLVAALCRVLVEQSFKVAPFKPQNMALNSAVTACGGEIGRAQAVQAKAAKVECHTDFNPILLKPNSDTGAQVIIHGKAISAMEAKQYHDYKKVAMQAVLDSHQRLSEQYDYIVVEGAGSPAEINLREGDIANMGFAEAVDCPVIIIADIDKGGVFAHLVGTLALLSPSEQNRVVGFVINRFRGDIKLLEPGLDWLEQKTGKPVLGVLPYLHGLTIAAEDAVSTEQVITKTKLKVIVPVLPRMSNHNDFDAMRVHPEIDLQFIYPKSEQEQTPLPAADLIVLPGSKNVISDLMFLRSQGWDKDIAKHLRYGGKVWGICGGYQMLGQTIADPLAIESKAPEQANGLGYIPMDTVLAAQKTLKNVSGTLCIDGQSANVKGYEIHAGESHFSLPQHALVDLQNENPSTSSTDQGWLSEDKQIAGSYTHGIFDQAAALALIAKWAGATVTNDVGIDEQEEKAIARLAKASEQHLDINKIKQIVNQWYTD